MREEPRDMFNKHNETQRTPSAEPTAPALEPTATAVTAAKSRDMPSIISTDLRVVGELHCAGDIQVEGKVEGDIKSKSVTVGEGAQVKGGIHAEAVRLAESLFREDKAFFYSRFVVEVRR